MSKNLNMKTRGVYFVFIEFLILVATPNMVANLWVFLWWRVSS